MKVFIDRHEVRVFNGACISDALMVFSSSAFRMVKEGKMQVLDKYGNPTGPDGPCHEGQILTLKKVNEL